MVEDFVDMLKQSRACERECVCVCVREFSEAGEANDSVSEQPHCHCNVC